MNGNNALLDRVLTGADSEIKNRPRNTHHLWGDRMAKGKPQDPAEPGMGMEKVAPKSTAVAASSYAADAGAGFEEMDSSFFLMPFVGIIQKMSPQVDTLGAKAGQIFNTATQDLYDGEGDSAGIVFIPVHTEHKFVEWVPREKGGGFVAAYKPDSAEVLKAKAEAGADFGKLSIGDNQLVETFYVYGIRLDSDGNTFPEVLAFSSTQIRAFKTWMTKARGIKLRDDQNRPFPAPLFAHRYRLTTQLQKNTKGTWHGWAVNWDGTDPISARIAADDPLYQEARKLRELVVSGTARADVQRAEPIDIEAEDTDKF